HCAPFRYPSHIDHEPGSQRGLRQLRERTGPLPIRADPRDAAPMVAGGTVKTLVIDGDGHVMEPPDLWVERMDHDRWGDWIPHRTVEDDIYETTYTGGQVRSGGRELHDSMAKA